MSTPLSLVKMQRRAELMTLDEIVKKMWHQARVKNTLEVWGKLQGKCQANYP